MKIVLICGDREWTDRARMRRKMAEVGFPGKVAFLIEGGARGADLMSKDLALELGFPKDRVIQYDADWKNLGKAAGPIRNRLQFKNSGRPPDLVLAFHDDPGRSRGTVDMVAFARSSGAEVWCSWEDEEYRDRGGEEICGT